MARITISEAEKLVNPSGKTLHRWTQQGKLSYSLNAEGVKVVDTAELERVCGPLKNPNADSRESHESGHRDTVSRVETADFAPPAVPDKTELVSSLERHIESLTSQLETANRQLDRAFDEKAGLLRVLENQTLMLPKPEEEVEKLSWWQRLRFVTLI